MPTLFLPGFLKMSPQLRTNLSIASTWDGGIAGTEGGGVKRASHVTKGGAAKQSAARWTVGWTVGWHGIGWTVGWDGMG